VLIVAYIIYNFVFIKEGMNETPGYNNKDTGDNKDVGACTIVFGDHNPENRFTRFKNTLNDTTFQNLLKESKPKYKKNDIKKYDIEYYLDFASGKPTTNFNNLIAGTFEESFNRWKALDNDKKAPTGDSVTQYLFNQISSTCDKYNQIKNLNNPGANRELPSFGSTTVATSSGDNDGGVSAKMTPKQIQKANAEYQAYLNSQNGDSGHGVQVDEGDDGEDGDEVEDGDEAEDG
jgi:hypothetical protein